MTRDHYSIKTFASSLKYLLLPLLAAVYPAIFHYSNNANLVQISSLGQLLLVMSAVAVVSYLVFLAVARGQGVKASVGALIFLLFFQTYGLVFAWLRRLDVVQIEHYTLLPLFLLLAGYASWAGLHLRRNQAERAGKDLTLILSVLILVSVAKAVPVEIRKAANSASAPQASPGGKAAVAGPVSSTEPDIYYIIFDEMAGFQAMREYWNYQGVDDFVTFLKSKDFFVAEGSHGSTSNTFYELASRLNYQTYPHDPKDEMKYWEIYFEAFDENRVMKFLKERGYKIIVYDEGSPMTAKFRVDYLYQTSMNEILSWGSLFDDFGMLVIKNTMIAPFVESRAGNDPSVRAHERMLYFTQEQAPSVDVASPKFVFIHLLIPHMPFLYNDNGNPVDPKQMYDWDKYLGYYIFSMHYAETMIGNILASADPARPPVVVFQSDHGARNGEWGDNVRLQNYPVRYKTSIVSAWHLPGCDTSVLSQDMNPINTFPIIFNCYFDAGIPMIK